MDPERLAKLLARLERGAIETGFGARRGMLMVASVLSMVATIFLFQGRWIWVGVLTAASMSFAFMAIQPSAPEKLLSVVRALRDSPDDVTWIGHYRTSGLGSSAPSEWIEIRTASRMLLVKATEDWEEILALLGERCPRANVRR